MHFNWLIVTFEFSFYFIFISFVKVHELFNGATQLAQKVFAAIIIIMIIIVLFLALFF